MAPGSEPWSLDQDSVDIKKSACITRIERGNPKPIRVWKLHTNDLKEMAQKMGLAGHADRKFDTSWAS